MSFKAPEATPDLSLAANTAIKVAALAGRLAVEKRTIVYNTDGSREDVAQHSFMLALVAPTLANRFPDMRLRPERVTQFAIIHDAVEAYVGDTATHDITTEGLRDKATREAAGANSLRQQYANMPHLVDLVDEYEAQATPEARFVRIVDKLMPVLTYTNDGGRSLRIDGITGEQLRTFATSKMERLRPEYPDMDPVFEVWSEIVEHIAANLSEV